MDTSLKAKKPTGRPKRIDGAREQELCQLYREHPETPFSEKAREYGVSQGTIVNTLIRNGIDPTKRRGAFIFPTTRFWKTRSSAKKRGIEFNVTMEYLQQVYDDQKGLCPYTGWKLTFPAYTDSYEGTASLDRVDSSKGYVEGNVQWVNKLINMMKHKHSHDDFIGLCKAVALYHVTARTDHEHVRRLASMVGDNTV